MKAIFFFFFAFSTIHVFNQVYNLFISVPTSLENHGLTVSIYYLLTSTYPCYL